MKALVVDDERPAREELQWLLEQCDGIEVAGEAGDADRARELLSGTEEPPDVVFLDIDMPGIDGIRFAECLRDLDPRPLTIFVSAYEEYALDAFDVDAVDYLLKPVRLNRLQEAVERAKERHAAQSESSRREDQRPLRRLSFRDGDGYRVVDTTDVLYFESDEGEVVAETRRNRYPTDFSLKALESKLDPDEFFRCHRSYIVRVDAIANIEPAGAGTYRLELGDAEGEGPESAKSVPLARSRVDDIQARIPWSSDALDAH